MRQDNQSMHWQHCGSIGWEKGPERGLETVSFNLKTACNRANREDPDQIPRSAASDLVCTVCQCLSPGFTDDPLYTALWLQRGYNM